MPTKSNSASPVDRQAWLRSLRGAESMVVTGPTDSGGYSEAFEGVDEATEFPGGTWRTSVILPVDLDLVDQWVDPLVALALLAAVIQRVDDKAEEMVAFCRSRGKSWTEIGRALDVSKQAAWERFSDRPDRA